MSGLVGNPKDKFCRVVAHIRKSYVMDLYEKMFGHVVKITTTVENE